MSEKPTVNGLYRELARVYLVLAALGAMIGIGTWGESPGWGIAAMVMSGTVAALAAWTYRQSRKDWS